MLRVNLLPKEYREPEKTPMGALLMVTVCTLLSVSSLCCVAYMYFGVLKNAEAARDIAKEAYENIAPMAKYADDLDAEKKEYMKRSEVIKDIETTRILWTKKIDQLLKIINNKGDRERHWAWLEDMQIHMGDSPNPGLKLKGYVGGDQFEQLSNFNRDLKTNKIFFEVFESISNPTGKTDWDDKKIPIASIGFDWKLELEGSMSPTKKKVPLRR